MPRKNFHPKISRTPYKLPCQDKRKFSNQSNVEKAIELAMLQTPQLELATYHCPHCGNWHLTSRPGH